MQLTRRNVTVWAVCCVACSFLGLVAAQAIASSPPPAAITRTITGYRTATRTRTRLVTVHVPAKIIHRYDHVIVWRTARYVFRLDGRRHVIPPHVVRVVYRRPTPAAPPVAQVAGVAPPPVTITVPETVTVPGPVQTVVSTVVSTQLVPTTTTETSVTTLTVSVPLTDPGTG